MWERTPRTREPRLDGAPPWVVLPRRLGCAWLIAAALAVEAGPAEAAGGLSTSLASVAADGTQPDRASFDSSISADGRVVAFQSAASALVPGDTNGVTDVFVKDMASGVVSIVSVDSDGAQGNDSSLLPSISRDGRFVAFQSRASNLVPGDSNGFPPGFDFPVSDIFVHDRLTGITSRVSVASDGSEADHSASQPRISADGQLVAFTSNASNLVPDDTNGATDIFVHDRATGTTERVSVAADGTEADPGQPDPGLPTRTSSFNPAISADGRHVAFNSLSSNLVPHDGNDTHDVFVRDRTTGTTTRVSVASDGTEANNASPQPSLSGDGRLVAFHSFATNLMPGDRNNTADVFVHDRQAGTTTPVLAPGGRIGNSPSFQAAISADGSTVGFASLASNLVPGDTNRAFDIFTQDRRSGRIVRQSVGGPTTQADDDSFKPRLSANGRVVAFESFASNLVAGDTNGLLDVFVRSGPQP